MDHEEALSGGNASESVVKIGGTVRKAWTESTPSVVGFLEFVRSRGVDAPAPRGQDERGRQIIEFVPGRLAIDAEPLSPVELHRVGAMVRAIHDASADFLPPADATWDSVIPAPGADLVCHNDLAPWNLIIGERWLFIDWDAAAPSTRLWDLAYAAQAFALSRLQTPPEQAAGDLRAFVDGYGADEELRAALPDAMTRRATAMLEMLRSAHAEHREPWASMFGDGHGAHWEAAVDYADSHQAVWQSALRI
ncbi:phosphotransferase [Microbacterium oxydans]|uniref:phosphotransferase n=1 Tax=Microbacterium oxydans TaxID=82380 RepID=UPI00226BB94D|nr:phosphotransferase [Microbacterium oxydans]WAA66079.1 phosphotransferase [Microbacterium oxydans]